MLGAGPEACQRQRSVLALFATLLEEGRLLCDGQRRTAAQTSEAIVGGIASIVQRRILQGDTASCRSCMPISPISRCCPISITSAR